jgi:meso-butanediol dehydrogenase/(S,S)-butanediol dehydrogenase/diacetyl reductase
MTAQISAAELRDRGIRVNSLSPEFTTETSLFEKGVHRPGGSREPSHDSRELRFTRPHRPEEIAAAVFLDSDKSRCVTGIDLPVDGGYVQI